MPWRDAPGGGFTLSGVEPWLPIGDTSECNVEQARADDGSMLNFCRDLIALRRQFSELQTGSYAPLEVADGVWAFRRGDRFVVALNMSDRRSTLEDLRGTISICTDRSRDGAHVDGTVELGEWEGLIVDAAGA